MTDGEVLECEPRKLGPWWMPFRAGAPKTAAMVKGTTDVAGGGGGWAWILSDLKTLL